MPRKANPAFMKPKTISPELAEVVGKGPMPAPEVMKKLWDYIKKNGLQDPTNKRTIVADDKLKVVFEGQGKMDMMKMAKYVFKNLS